MENVFSTLPVLKTERLLLRKITLRDTADLFAYACDPQVTRFTTWPPHQSAAETRQFIRFILNQYECGQVAPWGIEHRADKILIGTCGFTHWARHHARAELGYALSRPYWNQGYMSEAVHAAIAFGFEQMRLNRLEARCQVDNVASSRVMEKNGMRFEGVLRGHIFARGSYHDLKIYSLLRSDLALSAS